MADEKRFHLLMAAIGRSVTSRSGSIPAVRITYLLACFGRSRWIPHCSSSPWLGSLARFYGGSPKVRQSALHSVRVLEVEIPGCRGPFDRHTPLLASGF